MIGITGASGVLGRLVCKRLEGTGIPITAFAGDIRDVVAVRAWLEAQCPDRLIHLAARVAVDVVERAPLDAFAVNVGGTMNLATEAARLASPPWLFVASTSHVYRPSQQALRETDPLHPQNVYAQTKVIAETTAEFIARHAPLRLCVGRIFSFYHSTQHPPFLLPAITAQLRQHDAKQPFVVRNGLDVRDMSDAGDIADMVARIALERAVGTINIGSGKGTRVLDFVKELAGEQISLVARQEREPSSLVADTTRMREALNVGTV